MINRAKLEDLITYIESTSIHPTNEVYYKYILKFSNSYTITYLCKTFGVGKSSYYDWHKKLYQVDPDIKIRDMIIKISIKKHKDTMGYRMVTKQLNDIYDIKINHKKVYRIMKKYGLLSASWYSPKMKILYRGIKPYSNLVNRNFNVQHKNSIWCIDITKIDSKEGRQYLCVIIDLYDRAIVGYKIYKNQTVRLVKNTIECALNNEDLSLCPKLVLHSDQGRVFKTSNYLKDFLKDTPIIQSMGEKSSPCENSVIESFFSNLKKERLYIDDFETNEDIAMAVIDYIYWYNRARPHSYNNYCSPYEKRYPSE
jgi:transposase InsO family protein